MDLSTAAVAAASEVPPDLDGEELAIDGASISMVVCFKVMDACGYFLFYPHLLATPVQIILETKGRGRV